MLRAALEELRADGNHPGSPSSKSPGCPPTGAAAAAAGPSRRLPISTRAARAPGGVRGGNGWGDGPPHCGAERAATRPALPPPPAGRSKKEPRGRAKKRAGAAAGGCASLAGKGIPSAPRTRGPPPPPHPAQKRSGFCLRVGGKGRLSSSHRHPPFPARIPEKARGGAGGNRIPPSRIWWAGEDGSWEKEGVVRNRGPQRRWRRPGGPGGLGCPNTHSSDSGPEDAPRGPHADLGSGEALSRGTYSPPSCLFLRTSVHASPR